MASRAPDLLIYIFVAAGAGACGWVARGWYDGTTVSVVDAAGTAQQQVDAGVAAQQRVDSERQSVAQAAERVRIVEREVVVDGACPPGRGPVSPDLADELRALAAARKDSGRGAGGVPSSGD